MAEQKLAYAVTTRGAEKYWTRIGTVESNHDGSLTVKLEAMPVSGEIHIRDYVPHGTCGSRASLAMAAAEEGLRRLEALTGASAHHPYPEYARGLRKALELAERLGVSEGYPGRPLALVEIRKLKESLEKELQRLEKESHRTG